MGADPRVGTELAGHRILSVIGRGGMAVVYLAEHLRLGRRVALKVLDPQIAEDQAFRDRFIRESRIAAGLDHPNVVTVYDAGEADGVLYLSMRYVKGTDLERLLREDAKLEPPRAVSIISQCAAALDTAHAEGLVHRDVKPANILLASEGRGPSDRVYLSDFGVTKRLHSGAGLTRTGQFVGTVDYVAPEQIRGEDVDGRADVYSLGCVLYRCLTGEVPFPRETEVGTIYAHLEDAPAAPTTLRPELGPDIDQVVSRALAKDPHERFTFCRELSLAATRAFSTSGAALSTTPRIPTDVPAGAGRRVRAGGRRRSRLVWGGIVAGAAVAVVAAVALTFLLRSGPAQKAPSSIGDRLHLPRLTWIQFPDINRVMGGAGNQDIGSVVTVNGALVAVGHDDVGGDRNAAIWTSTNGTRWQRVRSDQFGGIGQQRMDGAAVLNGRVVAVGSEISGGDTDPAAWISEDAGATWQRVNPVSSGLLHAGNQLMHNVVETSDSLLAVGHEATGESIDAAVWTSSDGTVWTRETAFSFGGTGHEEMLGATTFNGDLVTVGYGTAPGEGRDAAVWVKSGGTWSRVTDDSLGGPGDQQMNAVLDAGPDLVAVGSDTSGEVPVWVSTDGRTWDRVRSQVAFAGPGAQSMYALARIGSVFLAAGSSQTVQGDLNGAVWLSADGKSWKRLPPTTSTSALAGLGQQRVNSLVRFGPRRLIAVGSETRAQDDQGAVWIGTLSEASS
jgi:tRNA A-37 threonylcarbamoyl transferase component Bud32